MRRRLIWKISSCAAYKSKEILWEKGLYSENNLAQKLRNPTRKRFTYEKFSRCAGLKAKQSYKRKAGNFFCVFLNWIDVWGAAGIWFYLHKEFARDRDRIFSIQRNSVEKSSKSMVYSKRFPRCARPFVENFLRKVMTKSMMYSKKCPRCARTFFFEY